MSGLQPVRMCSQPTPTLPAPLPCCSPLGPPQLKQQLAAIGIDPAKSCGEDSLPLRRALVAGLFPHAAKRQLDGGRRRTSWLGHGGACSEKGACSTARSCAQLRQLRMMAAAPLP